jgi:hypothetical protein
MNWWIIFIQLIGVAALLLDITTIQLRLRKHMLIVQIIATILWTVHYVLLPGGMPAAAMNVIAVIRSITFYVFRTESRPRIIPYVLGLLIVLGGILTWRNFSSILPVVASLLALTAFWQRREQLIRFFLFLAIPFWFGFNFIHGSYAGMLSDSIAGISTMVGLYRYRKQGMKIAERQQGKSNTVQPVA